VVFVTHEITPVAGLVDRVLYVAGGRWAAGRPEAVMTTGTLSALYGGHIDVMRVHGRIVVVGGDSATSGIHHLQDDLAVRPPGGHPDGHG
jgi:zinc/manganese transport system ATP-binding protein